MMMVQYLLDTDAPVEIPASRPRPPPSLTSPPIQLALEQEKRVTEQIYGLLRIARERTTSPPAVHAVVHQGAQVERSPP